MSTKEKILTREQIQQMHSDALAAVDHARAVLDRAREVREKLGETPESVQMVFDALPASNRAWINSVVNSGLAQVTAHRTKAQGSGKARKMRRHV